RSCDDVFLAAISPGGHAHDPLSALDHLRELFEHRLLAAERVAAARTCTENFRSPRVEEIEVNMTRHAQGSLAHAAGYHAVLCPKLCGSAPKCMFPNEKQQAARCHSSHHQRRWLRCMSHVDGKFK